MGTGLGTTKIRTNNGSCPCFFWGRMTILGSRPGLDGKFLGAAMAYFVER